jgi:hypothetical protein
VYRPTAAWEVERQGKKDEQVNMLKICLKSAC